MRQTSRGLSKGDPITIRGWGKLARATVIGPAPTPGYLWVRCAWNDSEHLAKLADVRKIAHRHPESRNEERPA